MGDSRTAKKKEKREEEFLLCLLGAVLEPARGQPGRMRPWLGCGGHRAGQALAMGTLTKREIKAAMLQGPWILP